MSGTANLATESKLIVPITIIARRERGSFHADAPKFYSDLFVTKIKKEIMLSISGHYLKFLNRKVKVNI